MALASRLFLVVVTMLSAASMKGLPPGAWNRGPVWVQGFGRWDSGYYLDIATLGYGASSHLWAFNPGYPLSIRAVTSVLPIGPEVAGFIIANGCFFVAVILFHRWTSAVLGPERAFLATAFLIWYPGSFFYTAIYPESMFLLLLILAFWAFQREKWATAGLVAAAANSVRPHGIFLAPAFALALAWRWRAGERPPARSLFALALAPTFILVFSAYAWQQTGDPMIWVHARENLWPDVGWHDPWTTVGRVFDVRDQFGLPLLGLTMMLLGTVHAARRLRQGAPVAVRAPILFAFLLVAVSLFYSAPPSLLRYSLAVLPIFWMLADTMRTRTRVAATMLVSADIAGVVAFLFATWRPAF